MPDELEELVNNIGSQQSFGEGGLERLSTLAPITIGSFEGGPTDPGQAFSSPSLSQAKAPSNIFEEITQFGGAVAAGLGSFTEGLAGLVGNAGDIARDIDVIRTQTFGTDPDTSTAELARLRAQKEQQAQMANNVTPILVGIVGVGVLVWLLRK